MLRADAAEMPDEPPPDLIAAELEARIARARAAAAPDTRTLEAHADAITHLEEYTRLLRASMPREEIAATRTRSRPARYLLKLEFPDGRWQLSETLLERRPPKGRFSSPRAASGMSEAPSRCERVRRTSHQVNTSSARWPRRRSTRAGRQVA